MKKRITYLLGAGASANAIPIMGQLVPRMRFFLELLIEAKEMFDKTESWSNNQIKELESILGDITELRTPDTLARIYGLTGQDEKLTLLKDFLSCYMLFEQFEIESKPGDCYFTEEILKERWLDHSDEDIRKKLEEVHNNKIDNRHIEFFTTVLAHDNKANVILPDNISVLLWNYDHQIEKSLGYFSRKSITNLQKDFGIFPRTEEDDSQMSEEELSKNYSESRIIKLTGTAGFIPNSNYGLFDINHHKLDNRAWRVFSQIIFGVRDMTTKQNKLAFAWNKTMPRVRAARNLAKLKLKETDVLVIVGYSFPNFNREVDREIFSEFHGEKICIQDLYPKDISLKLDGVKKGLPHKELYETASSFVIPNEYWEK